MAITHGTERGTLKVPNTPKELHSALKKLGVDHDTYFWLAGYDHTRLLMHILGATETTQEEELLGTDMASHRQDIRCGPILEYDPRTGTITVGLDEGSDSEKYVEEYATKEEIERYVSEWRVDLSAMDRILGEEYPELDVDVDETATQYIITYNTNVS